MSHVDTLPTRSSPDVSVVPPSHQQWSSSFLRSSKVLTKVGNTVQLLKTKTVYDGPEAGEAVIRLTVGQP